MNSKKTLLSLINGGAILGAAGGAQTVKFAYTENIAKVGTAADGTITFYADTTNKTGIIAVGGDVVSSKILNVTSAAVNNGKTGENTITVTFFNASTKAADTITFDVVNAAAAKAYFEDYFTNSNTITITDGTADVNVDSSTILIDTTNKYLKSGLNIYYKAPVTTAGSEENAKIQLRDAHNAMLSEIDVADIVGNGVVDYTSYNSSNNTLSIFFKNAAGGTDEVKINLSELFDIDDWAVETGSEDFLHLTIDASTAKIGVKKADVTFTEKSGNTPANLTVDTTAGEILVASDAIPAIKSYVDAQQADNGISAEGDSYIDASVDATNNKKINIEAQTADLTITAGSIATASDSSLAGTAGKLVDAADAAAKVQSFVNARLTEEVTKLDASIDSTPGTFISAGVKEVDGKITSVVVHENIGSITGTAENLTGTAGLIDGANAASAVKTYVDGQIDASIKALDADITSDDATYTTVEVVEVDGKITDVVVSQTKSTITASANALSGTAGIADGSEFAAGVKTYVDGQIDALDSELNITSSDASLTFDASVVNGKIVEGHIGYVKSTVEFSDTAGLNLTGTAGFVTGEAIAEIKEYVDAKSGSLDSQIVESDASTFVTVTTGMIDGALADASSSVAVKYADVTAAPGAITVNTNGIVKGDVLEAAIEGALTWTVLS